MKAKPTWVNLVRMGVVADIVIFWFIAESFSKNGLGNQISNPIYTYMAMTTLLFVTLALLMARRSIAIGLAAAVLFSVLVLLLGGLAAQAGGPPGLVGLWVYLGHMGVIIAAIKAWRGSRRAS